MYHKVCRDATQFGKFTISPEEFEADLRFLQNSHYTPVTMADLIAFVHDGGDLPAHPILLSFDDGYFGDYHYVFPLACAYETPIVTSIIGSVTDEYSNEGRTDIIYPHLLWSQISEMAASGYFEFQNHSYDLHCVRGGTQGARRRNGESPDAYQTRLSSDLTHLQDSISAHTGQNPSTFTYPFGAKSDSSDQILQALGFSASLMTEAKQNLICRGEAACLFSLGRILRPHGTSLASILSD